MKRLMHAAVEGQMDSMKLLIQKRALLNATDNNGLTPLMHAALAGHTNIVKYLNHTGLTGLKCDKFPHVWIQCAALFWLYRTE